MSGEKTGRRREQGADRVSQKDASDVFWTKRKRVQETGTQHLRAESEEDVWAPVLK